MIKENIVEKVRGSTDITVKQAEAAVNAVFEALKEGIISGDKVTISGFGSFFIQKINVKGEVRDVPKFKPSRGLRKKVNNG